MKVSRDLVVLFLQVLKKEKLGNNNPFIERVIRTPCSTLHMIQWHWISSVKMIKNRCICLSSWHPKKLKKHTCCCVECLTNPRSLEKYHSSKNGCNHCDVLDLYQQTALGAPTIVDHHLHHHHLSGELLLEFVFQNYKANEKCMYLKTATSGR